VLFTLQPLIDNSDETNETYNIQITAKALNAPSVSQTFTVFIPYQQNIENFTNMSNNDLINLINLLKTQLNSMNLEASPNCPSSAPWYDTIEKRCRGDLKFEAPVGYNYSQAEIQSFLVKLTTLEDDIKTTSTYQNPILDDLKLKLIEVLNALQNANKVANNSLTLAQQNKDELEQGKTYRTFVYAIIGIIMLAIATFGVIKYRQYKERETQVI